MPSTPSLPRPASPMALRTASTVIARVLRADCRLYSVSPTPTMQYLSLSDAMALLDDDRVTMDQAASLYASAAGGVKRWRPGLAAGIVGVLGRGPLRIQDGREGAGRLRALDAHDTAQPADRVADAHGGDAGGAGPVA